MKFQSITLSALFIISSTAAFGAAKAPDQQYHRNPINVSSAIIPSGFDNSEPRAVVSGLFPNSCYKWDGAEVNHVDALNHEVRNFAQVRSGYCLMVMIPFSEEVALGKFVTGHHSIKFINSDGSQFEKQLDVE